MADTLPEDAWALIFGLFGLLQLIALLLPGYKVQGALGALSSIPWLYLGWAIIRFDYRAVFLAWVAVQLFFIVWSCSLILLQRTESKP